MTVPDFNRIAAGYYRRIDREHLMLGALLAQVFNFSYWSDPNKKLTTAADWVRLSGDKKAPKKRIKPPPTPEEMERLNRRFNQ